MKPKILIIGAGFAGVACAKKLYEHIGKEATITLVSKTSHFELHATFYKVLSECSPAQACIPLEKIFIHTHVNVVTDTITQLNTDLNIATGEQGDKYPFDYAVIALGSEPTYFGIPGASNFSHTLANIQEAIRLSKHIHDQIIEKSESKDESTSEIVVIGGGPTGVEVAGELAQHIHKLTDGSPHVHIRLVEALDRILNNIPLQDAQKIQARLEQLGVQVQTNTKVEQETPNALILNGTPIPTPTVIWTAGVKANHLYAEWGLSTAKNGRVLVNKYLQTEENENIFIAGDGAQVEGSGTAWPAIAQGSITATNIANKIKNHSLQEYQAQSYPFFVPVGSDWSYAVLKHITLWGIFGWYARQRNLLELLTKMLPYNEALQVLKSQNEICSICQTYTDELDQKSTKKYN